jgi:hypothetical protein
LSSDNYIIKEIIGFNILINRAKIPTNGRHIGIHIDTYNEGTDCNTHEEDIESNLSNASVDMDEVDPNDDLPPPSFFL